MKIYRYDQASLTGYVMVPVPDDYELQKGELKELPYPCYTPMKLDSAGNLVSATIEESNDYAKEHKAAPVATPTQQAVSMVTVQMTQIVQQVQSLQTVVKSQSQLIEKLMNANSSSNAATSTPTATSSTTSTSEGTVK